MMHLLLSLVALPAAAGFGSLPVRRIDLKRASNPRMAPNTRKPAPRLAPSAQPTADFLWEPQWYPVLPLSYLDGEKPTSVQLLGKRLAVWRSSRDGAWSCVEDACPHRLAPLSTGKVSANGALTCRYHGWTFDGEGRGRSPMATTPEAQARVCQEACATTFPTQAAGGLLWVWPSSGRDAWAESAATEPPADESLADAEWTFQLQPLSYESLVENVLDPTHAPFLHEGLAGQVRALSPSSSPHLSTPRVPSTAFEPPCAGARGPVSRQRRASARVRPRRRDHPFRLYRRPHRCKPER